MSVYVGPLLYLNFFSPVLGLRVRTPSSPEAAPPGRQTLNRRYLLFAGVEMPETRDDGLPFTARNLLKHKNNVNNTITNAATTKQRSTSRGARTCTTTTK